MAADDIYRLEVNFEGPTQAASFGIYYLEDAPRTTALSDTIAVNDAFQNINQLPLRNVLAADWQMPSSDVHKVFGDPVPMDAKDFGNPIGIRPAPSLPANNAAVLTLTQVTFPRSSNGRIYIPGLSESDTDTGVFQNDYLTGVLSDLAASLSAGLTEVAGTGVWLPIVISAIRRDAVPGQKDWPAAVGSVVSFDPNPVIARQVRRVTRVRGKR